MLKLFYNDMFLWKLSKRMFYLYYVTFEGLLIPDSGVPDLSFPKTSAQRASVTKRARKMSSYVAFRTNSVRVNRTRKANKAIFSTNLSVYMAAKNGIWFILSWKCFFILCEVDYSRMNGKVRRAGGTRSVCSCPHLQRLVYRLF